jgi:hypothetical protein
MTNDWNEFRQWMAETAAGHTPLQITLTNSGTVTLYHPLHFGDTFVSGGNDDGKLGSRSAVPYHAIMVASPLV